MMHALYASGLLLATIYTSLVIVLDLHRNGFRSWIERPRGVFSIYFGLVHFVTPAIKYMTGMYRYHSSYPDEVLLINLVQDFLAYNIALMIFQFFNREASCPVVGHSDDLLVFKRVGFAVFTFGALFAAHDYWIIRSMGLQNFLMDRIYSSQERGSARALSFLMIPGLVLYMSSLILSKRRSWAPRYIAVVMILSITAYYFTITQRNSVMLAALLLLCTILIFGSHASTRYVPSRRFWGIALGMMTVVFVGYQMTVDRYSTGQSAYATQRREHALFYGLDGSFGNDEINDALEELPYRPLWGQTYLAGLLAFVPRAVWLDKPVGAGPQITNWIAPDSYVIGRSGISSVTTGLMFEAKMNFGRWGWPGVIVVWSVIVGFAFRRGRRSFDPLAKLIWTIVGISLVSMFVYYEFLGFVVHFALLIAPLLLVGLFRPHVRAATR